jgi:hypothetical protein
MFDQDETHHKSGVVANLSKCYYLGSTVDNVNYVTIKDIAFSEDMEI